LRKLLLCLVASVDVVQFALEEYATYLMDSHNLLVRESSARQSNLVETCVMAIVRYCDVWWNILRYTRHTLDHGVVADMSPLVYGRVTAYYHPISHVYLSCE
jgi:hypothetical protein